jgi:DNA-nicking Smr family endonuclease
MASKRGRRSIRYDAVDDADRPRPPREPQPPQVLLRLLRLEDALHRLDTQLRAFQRHGTHEVLVVHGKGQQSVGGIPVLAPAVREWCDRHGDVVLSWREAPRDWGGEGAIVVQLRI